MTLRDVIRGLEGIAEKQPNINTIVKSGDIYDLNSMNNVRYSAFCVTQQQHQEGEEFITYNFYAYYVDRLRSDCDNKLDIQSHGLRTLSNILRTFENKYDVDIENIVYQVFTNRFESECAGVYASFSISVLISDLCEENYE